MATVILNDCQMETTTQGTLSYVVTDLVDRADIMKLSFHLSELNIANGDLVPLCIRQVDGDAEWGLYTFNDNGGSGLDTFDRTTIQGSTIAGGGQVTWGAGTKTVTACIIGDGGLVIASNNGSDFTNNATFRSNLDLSQLSLNGSDFTAATFRTNIAVPGLSGNNTMAGLQTFTGGVVTPVTDLTDAATILWDALTDGSSATHTLINNRILGNITNVTAGMTFNIAITQDGVGSRTLTYGTNYKFPGGVAPVVSPGIGEVTIISIYAASAVLLYATAVLDMS